MKKPVVSILRLFAMSTAKSYIYIYIYYEGISLKTQLSICLP
jgi:hypothetical protein